MGIAGPLAYNMAMNSGTPLVSIVTATYNRSNVLRLAIESVRASTLQDWEMIVVGDACTDDTETVVASFGDPRIQFVNLPENTGDQSGPNNEGCRRATGRYIAFLNHDDLWMPNHLEVMTRRIEESGADLVFALALRINPEPPNEVMCLTRAGRYDPSFQMPASCWLFRRELLGLTGPWRPHREIYTVPSQDWLLRASRAGKDLRLSARVTVLMFPTTRRDQCYAGRESHDQTHYLERIQTDSTFVEQELTHAIIRQFDTAMDFRVRRHLGRAARALLHRVFLSAGISFETFRYFLRYRRKGGFVDELRARQRLTRHK